VLLHDGPWVCAAAESTNNIVPFWGCVGQFGRAVARAVSHRPLTAEARVRIRVSSCGICGGQNGTGTGFSPSFSVFLCQYYSIIPLDAHPGMNNRPVFGHSLQTSYHHISMNIGQFITASETACVSRFQGVDTSEHKTSVLSAPVVQIIVTLNEFEMKMFVTLTVVIIF
jgi:hypothetical protein